MSSIPGYTLESFLIWNLNLIVEDTEEANFSLSCAELIGTVHQRPMLTQEQFKQILALFDPVIVSDSTETIREMVERRLDDFEEDEQSWRDYCNYVDTDVPEELYDKARALIASFAA